ncbi:MAG TPA: hypothetical protein VMM93_00480 [Vicinamibacterales bacterium]|nr:hypothetical protein [Vicinamibacterales bacterium]
MRYSRVRIVDEAGGMLRDARVLTQAERLVQAFAGVGPVRIVVESRSDHVKVMEA